MGVERLENHGFEQFVGSGVHVCDVGVVRRPVWARVVVVGGELTVVVVRSKQLKRRPNFSGITR